MTHRLPITLGVIGHLDGVLTEQHRRAFVALLDQLHRHYPHCPVSLLSQLAPGVDTEVAEWFVGYGEEQGRDYRLVTPFPMEVGQHTAEFTPEQRTRFDALHARAVRSFTLRAPEGTSTNLLYRRGGQFVADTSLILLAFWDGTMNHKVGGTSETIHYLNEGVFPGEVTETLFDARRNLLVFGTARARSAADLVPPPVPGPDALRQLLDRAPSLKTTLRKLDEINAEFRRALPAPPYPLPFEEVATAHPPPSGANKLFRWFAAFDARAIYSQRHYRRVLISLFVLGAALFAFFEWYKQFGLQQHIIAGILIIVGILLLLPNFSGLWKSHLRYIESRVLAEALRVQLFWHLAGIRRSVDGFIVRIHRAEFDWVQYVLRAVYGLSYPIRDPEEVTVTETFDPIAAHWLNDQAAYFERSLGRIEQRSAQFRRAALLTLGLALALFGFIVYLSYVDTAEVIIQRVVVVATILFGAAALLKAYYDKIGYAEIEKQYLAMHDLYRTAEVRYREILANEQLSAPERRTKLQHLLYLAGREALLESGNWYLVFKDKEPEIEGFG